MGSVMRTVAEITELLGILSWRIQLPQGECTARVDRVFDPLPNATNLVFRIEFAFSGEHSVKRMLVRTFNEVFLSRRYLDELREAIQMRLGEEGEADIELDFVPSQAPAGKGTQISESASSYSLGENHPLASSFGAFENEPLWDELIGAMNDYRREVAAEELLKESGK